MVSGNDSHTYVAAPTHQGGVSFMPPGGGRPCWDPFHRHFAFGGHSPSCMAATAQLLCTTTYYAGKGAYVGVTSETAPPANSKYLQLCAAPPEWGPLWFFHMVIWLPTRNNFPGEMLKKKILFAPNRTLRTDKRNVLVRHDGKHL